MTTSMKSMASARGGRQWKNYWMKRKNEVVFYGAECMDLRNRQSQQVFF
jgi:hypothetical protein